MTAPEVLAQLDAVLDTAYLGHERLTVGELRRYAVDADLPGDAMSLLDGLPEGEYAQDEAAEALRQVPTLIDPGDAPDGPVVR